MHDTRLRDWLLFALTLSSGAVDVISFLALGRVFTAFMTGSIVFLGMGIAGDANAPSVVAVLASMTGFGLESYIAIVGLVCGGDTVQRVRAASWGGRGRY